MSCSVRTVLVDRNDLFREGLRRILSETSFRVTRDSATLEGILEGFSGKAPPQLLILNAVADYRATASEVRRFKDCYPDARVVMLTDHCDFDGVISVLQAGANGFVLKRV